MNRIHSLVRFIAGCWLISLAGEQFWNPREWSLIIIILCLIVGTSFIVESWRVER